jgi:hypothetical protein
MPSTNPSSSVRLRHWTGLEKDRSGIKFRTSDTFIVPAFGFKVAARSGLARPAQRLAEPPFQYLRLRIEPA